MAVIEAKGLRIGEGRTKAIVSLMDETPEALAATAGQAVAAGADCLEWRVDYFGAFDDLDLVSKVCRIVGAALPTAPLIFTFRTKAQGGQCELDAASYEALLRAVMTDGAPDFVDIEVGLGDEKVADLIAFAHEHGVRAIVSHHDFGGTPEVDAMTQILLHEAALGADIPKLAVMARSTTDAHKLMRATALAREQLDVPLLTMAMGAAGERTRMTGEVFGSALTFCALGRASAPGQVELGYALQVMDAMHRTLTEKQE